MIEYLPGAELVAPGLADLERGELTIAALVVAIGRPRLSGLGVAVPPGPPEPEHRLFRALQATHGDGAHAAYNALIRRLVSFERALERSIARPASRSPARPPR
jgi:hypothetical protein